MTSGSTDKRHHNPICGLKPCTKYISTYYGFFSTEDYSMNNPRYGNLGGINILYLLSIK